MINVGSGSSIDDIVAGTLCAWVMPTDTTTNGRIWHKGLLGTGFRIFDVNFSSLGKLRFSLDRVTNSLRAESGSGVITANAWNFCAGVYNAAGADSDQKLYVGSLVAIAAEVPSYTSRTVGVGSVISDVAADGIIGNRSSAGTFFPGAIAWLGLWNRVLAKEEIVGTPGGRLLGQQFNPRPTAGCVGSWYPGDDGASSVVDRTGNGNTGTIIGATVSVRVPLEHPARLAGTGPRWGGRARRDRSVAWA